MKIFKNTPKKEMHLFFVMAFFQICGLVGILFVNKEITLSLTPYNLMIATFCILFVHHENKKIIFFLLIASIIGFSSEYVGIHYGFPFGEYQYGKMLGYKLLDVPVIIGINWFILSISCAGISGKVFNKPIYRMLCGSSLMIILDMAIEPIAPALDFWEFKGGVAPLQNYLGWFAISFIIQGIYLKLNINFSSFFSIFIFLTQIGFFVLLQFLM